jgi:hypothetical protein
MGHRPIPQHRLTDAYLGWLPAGDISEFRLDRGFVVVNANGLAWLSAARVR